MVTSSKAKLYLSLSTPLGKDALVLTGFRGEEQISGLFHFSLEMFSEDPDLDFTKIVGKSVTVSIPYGEGDQRRFNGVVGQFVQAGTDTRGTTYYAEIHPWLWLLTMTVDCRIFQNQTVPQIIEAVFKDAGFSDYQNKLTGTYESRDYCVQYRESTFDFLSRLMEDEGIFYFFEHDAEKHTLVLADAASAHAPCSGLAEARYGKVDASWEKEDVVTRCIKSQQVTPAKYRMGDFNFETPANPLLASVSGAGKLNGVYEYPGGFLKNNAGEKKVKARIESLELPQTQLKGEGQCRAFVAGRKFNLTGHERSDVNGSYILRWVSHAATQEEYSNSFEAFPLGTPFRPPLVTKKPVVVGAQTAIVVGKEGEEIWTDKYGRVKVQFHWDQQGKNDENSSCWIRLAQSWAGKNWGSLFLPRVGQEALVSFLEGDPDRPVITGGMYNAQQTVPYALPGNQTKSTIKSASSKGGGGFNEIRFEDKKDAEELFVHAQKDLTLEILNDETRTIKQNRTTTVREKDDTLIVDKGNRIIKVNTGNETHAVKGTRSLTVTGDENRTNKAKFTQDVTDNYVLTVKGNLTIDVTGTVTIKAGSSMTHKAGTSLTNEAGTTLTNKAGTSLTNEASVSMTNKASASQTVDGGGMLTVKGGMVKIN